MERHAVKAGVVVPIHGGEAAVLRRTIVADAVLLRPDAVGNEEGEAQALGVPFVHLAGVGGLDGRDAGEARDLRLRKALPLDQPAHDEDQQRHGAQPRANGVPPGLGFVRNRGPALGKGLPQSPELPPPQDAAHIRPDHPDQGCGGQLHQQEHRQELRAENDGPEEQQKNETVEDGDPGIGALQHPVQAVQGGKAALPVGVGLRGRRVLRVKEVENAPGPGVVPARLPVEGLPDLQVRVLPAAHGGKTVAAGLRLALPQPAEAVPDPAGEEALGGAGLQPALHAGAIVGSNGVDAQRVAHRSSSASRTHCRSRRSSA